MGALTSGNVRISLPPTTTQPDVDALITALGTAIRTVRADLPVTANPAPVLPQPPESTATTIVDSRGRRCPLPVLDLARTLPSVDIGAEVLVLADDPAASSDIAAWCRMRRQELVDASNHGEGTTAFRVRRLH
jgi:cysteine desulfurase